MHPFVQIRKPDLLAFKLNNEPWLTENQIETKDSSKTKFHYILFSIKSDRFFNFPVIEWNKIKKSLLSHCFIAKPVSIHLNYTFLFVWKSKFE